MKSLIALFTSDIILNPMVLLGIIGGCYMMRTMESEKIHALFANPLFYVALLLLTTIYTLVLHRVYHADGTHINWKATTGGIFTRFITLIIAIVFSCLLIFTISFGNQ